METSSELTWLFNFSLVIAILSFYCVYFYFLHKIYGSKISKVRTSQHNLYFKTNEATYQVDTRHKKLMYKREEDLHWMSVSFKEIKGIDVVRSEKTATIIEFFFGGFTLFDFLKEYRDSLNICEIRLIVPSDHDDMNSDIILMTMKQYQQREFFIDRLMHNFNKWIMSKLGLYHDLDEKYDDKVREFIKLFNLYDLKLTYLRYEF